MSATNTHPLSTFNDSPPDQRDQATDTAHIKDLIERATEALASIAFTCESCRFSPTTLLQLLPSLKALETARRGAAIIDADRKSVV